VCVRRQRTRALGGNRVCTQRVEHLHTLGAGEDPSSVHQCLPAAWNAALVSASRSCGVAVSSRSLDLGPAPVAQAVVQAAEHTLLDQRQQPGQMLPEQPGVMARISSRGHGRVSLPHHWGYEGRAGGGFRRTGSAGRCGECP
jgi:hypothetical protein